MKAPRFAVSQKKISEQIQLSAKIPRKFQVSSPILRDVRFKYQEDEILSDSLTVTNFHTYYQGSEMVVAGKMEDLGLNPDELIEYKILATQALGQQYSILGAYNGSEVISNSIFEPFLQASVRWFFFFCNSGHFGFSLFAYCS